MTSLDTFTQVTSDLRVMARLTPWDTDCFGFAVGQIDTIECLNTVSDTSVMESFFQWLDLNAIRLVSCRIPYENLTESMLLEVSGFRFVETVLHPYLELSDSRYQEESGLSIEPAKLTDMDTLDAIAAKAFTHGRIHADTRLGPALGNKRYRCWVSNTLTHPRQKLLKVINEEGSIVALFITEMASDENIYWHLTAIAPQYHGQGYGWRVWNAMLAQHAREGIRSVSTTITAGNVPVLNLYSKLGFRFLPPEMTFHWLRESKV